MARRGVYRSMVARQAATSVEDADPLALRD